MKKLLIALPFLLPVVSAHALTGQEVYQQSCIACHGPDGKGAIPGAANFTLANGPISKTDEVLMKHITEGFQTPGNAMAMPPRGGNPALTDAELKDTLKYIRATFAPKEFKVSK